MQNYKLVEEELAFTKTVQQLVQSYEEIAIMKMQKIRASVENTREFMEDVNPIFAEVKKLYKYQEVQKMNKNELADIEKHVFSTIDKNGKNLFVLLTPNDRLIGSIGQKIYFNFINEVLGKEGDILVVGRLGRKLINQGHSDMKFKYFDAPKLGDSEDVVKITNYIMKYERIEIYYGKFNNLVNQEGFSENLSGDIKGGAEVNLQEKPKTDYIFEPSVEGVMSFFEVEVFNSMFKQKIAESELAKLGSRINAMEAATENTKIHKAQLQKMRTRLMHQADNKKQLASLSGISLWD